MLWRGNSMKKHAILMGRYALLILVALAIVTSVVVSVTMPRDLARQFGVIGAGWWAARYIAWRCYR